MHEIYKIEGCSNIHSEQLEGPEYKNPNYYPEFKNKLEEFKKNIIEKYNDCKGFVVMRIYDGELRFLRCLTPNKRHVTKKLIPKFIKPFKEGCYKVDILSTQLNIKQEDIFKNIFKEKIFDLPMEIIYGLFANKWLLKKFKNNIGLIGGDEKIKVIKELMKYQQYRNYVDNDYFVDYIEVPERCCCDNIEEITQKLKDKITNSKAKIFFYGFGIAKMAIAYKFKEFKNCPFIDIGCGMTALAGCCGTDRPYFGNWVNHRLKNYNYRNMDHLDFDNRNVVYL